MGRFDFGFGGHREQCLYTKPRATSQQTVFFCGWGGLGRFNFDFGLERGGIIPCFFEGGGGKVRLRVRWSLRAMFAQSPAHHPSTPFFYVWRRRVGEVRLRARRRVRWSSRAMSVQSLVHHPSKPFSFVDGGVGEVRLRVRLRVRWALRGISVQSPVHHPSNLFFCRGGVGEVRLRVRLRVR